MLLVFCLQLFGEAFATLYSLFEQAGNKIINGLRVGRIITTEQYEYECFLGLLRSLKLGDRT